MRFMTFDIGSRNNLGYARAIDDREPTWRVEYLPESGEDYGLCGLAFESFLLHQFESVMRPHVVGFATPLIFNDQPAGMRKLIGMAFMLETVCKRLKIEVFEDSEAAMRAYFLAPDPVPRLSDAIKKAVIDRCHALGWPANDHNAADALCVMDFLRAQKLKGFRTAAERSGLFR